jgi:hypothetical protein
LHFCNEKSFFFKTRNFIGLDLVNWLNLFEKQSIFMLFNTQLPSLSRSEILAKKAKLELAATTLKQEFIGLDKIIDEITDLILPWWLFPETQLRPTIINLWGMTGTGKTALIKRLTELLLYRDSTLVFDMGQYGGNSTALKYSFTGNLEFFNNKAPVIIFDEFQFAKTIDDGKEVNNDSLRVIWDLLDSGQFFYESYMSKWIHGRASKLLKLLMEARSRGVEVVDGRIVKGVKSFEEIVKSNTIQSFTPEEGVEKPKTEDYFLQYHFFGGIFQMVDDDFYDQEEIRDLIEKMNFEQIIELLIKSLSEEQSQKLMNLSKSIVFVIGNLDEAYYMSGIINPDISPDDFYKSTLKINIANIKRALQERFRNEQIARLGNNHVIYPAFNTDSYNKIIIKHLDITKNNIKERFGIDVQFDESILDIIFKEGVFPTQGARPVLTTIKNLVEGYISKMIVTILENELDVVKLTWRYDDEFYYIQFLGKKGKVLREEKYFINLKVNSLRKSQDNDLQAYVAVHESGHAILCALALEILPEYVVTRTVSSDANGFCKMSLPEDIDTKHIIKKRIIVGLGGYLAEKMIFGEEFTSTGVSDDLRKISELAHSAVKEFGMGADPVKYYIPSGGDANFFNYKEEHEALAYQIVRECEEEGQAILYKNRKLLLELANYLTSHSRIDKDLIEKFILEHSTEDWVRTRGFRDPERYYDFRKQVKDLL